MGWFIFGAFVGMFTTAWATLRMLEAIYPEVADEIASGEGMRKVQKWKEQNRK